MWWSIQFSDGSTGFMHLIDGNCQNVYRADGIVVNAEEKVEYTCTSMDAAQPEWYVAPTPTE